MQCRPGAAAAAATSTSAPSARARETTRGDTPGAPAHLVGVRPGTTRAPPERRPTVRVRGKPVRIRHGRATVSGEPLHVTVRGDWKAAARGIDPQSQDTGARTRRPSTLALREGPPCVPHVRGARRRLGGALRRSRARADAPAPSAPPSALPEIGRVSTSDRRDEAANATRENHLRRHQRRDRPARLHDRRGRARGSCRASWCTHNGPVGSLIGRRIARHQPQPNPGLARRPAAGRRADRYGRPRRVADRRRRAHRSRRRQRCDAVRHRRDRRRDQYRHDAEHPASGDRDDQQRDVR